MYSTNLTVFNEITLFSGDDCVGTAYGWMSEALDSPHNQTAKDNALLWSLSPKLADFLFSTEVYRALNAWGDIRLIELRTDLIAQLAHAIPPASVAQNG